jgi:hypothetical protein
MSETITYSNLKNICASILFETVLYNYNDVVGNCIYYIKNTALFPSSDLYFRGMSILCIMTVDRSHLTNTGLGCGFISVSCDLWPPRIFVRVFYLKQFFIIIMMLWVIVFITLCDKVCQRLGWRSKVTTDADDFMHYDRWPFTSDKHRTRLWLHQRQLWPLTATQVSDKLYHIM